MVTLHFIYLGTDESTLVLDPVEAPSVLAALGLSDAQLCRLCGSHATLGDDPSFDLLACLAALQKPGDLIGVRVPAPKNSGASDLPPTTSTRRRHGVGIIPREAPHRFRRSHPTTPP